MAITVDAYRLAFMPLPKSACTSVKRTLAQVDPDVAKDDTPDVQVWHEVYPTRRFRSDRWVRYADYFRFCVVRDPVKRLMSCYTDIVANREEMSNSPRLRKSKRYPVDPDPDYFFLNLDAYKTHSSLVKHHCMSAAFFIGTQPEKDFDRVYRTSEIDELGNDLSVRTGRVLAVPHANATKRKLVLDDLLDETVDAIRPFLEQEYALLKGYFRNPFGSKIHAACAIRN